MTERRDRLFIAVLAFTAAYLTVALVLTRRGAPLPPDSLEYAETARNLVRGRGYTINLIEIHAGLLPKIRHLHELHGLLTPLVLAPFFAVFGPNAALVRLPGLGFVAGTAVCGYLLGRELFGRAAGLIAAGLLLTNAGFNLDGALGGDDVGWTFFTVVSVTCLVRAVSGEGPVGRREVLFAGIAAGVSTLEKFSGAALAVACALAVLLTPVRRRFRAADWAALLLPTTVFAALYFIRNHLLYGSFGFRYGALDWLSKNYRPAYFAYFREPPKLFEVLREMGRPRVVELLLEQVHNLWTTVMISPVLLGAGPLCVLLVAWKRPFFATLTLFLTLGVAFFVIVPYHVEPRYLFGVFPPFAVGIGAVVALVFERGVLLLREPLRWNASIAGGAMLVAGVGALGFQTLRMHAAIGADPLGKGECDDALSYLKTDLQPEDAVFTTAPWIVTWITERATVIPPTNGAESIARVASHYRVGYAIDGFPTLGDVAMTDMLEPLLSGEGPIGAATVYYGRECHVYRLEPR